MSNTDPPVVLIVDDEALLRLTISEHLKDCGFFPIEACDAHEAIDILETRLDVDVVVTDVRMPGQIDGFGLAEWVRKNRPGLPVFLTSGYPGAVSIAEKLCESEQYFRKPYDFNLLVAMIRKRVESRQNKT
jgi:DNA-binding NtrC family response regulator